MNKLATFISPVVLSTALLIGCSPVNNSIAGRECEAQSLSSQVKLQLAKEEFESALYKANTIQKILTDMDAEILQLSKKYSNAFKAYEDHVKGSKPQYSHPDLTWACPEWQKPEYINIETKQDGKNFSIRDAIISFKENVIENNSLPEVNNNEIFTYKTHQQRQIGEQFKHVFIEAFSGDSISNDMPFNDAYFKKIIEEISFYFAKNENDKFLGIFNSKTFDDIFVTTHINNDSFALVIVHEIGHKLGLGESLSDLLAEECLKIPSVRDGHNWLYNSAFDRQLLKRAGAKKFWHAAFSNQYEQLWNEFIPEIQHSDISFMRSLGDPYVLNFIGSDICDYFNIDKHSFNNIWKAECADIINAFENGIGNGDENCLNKFLTFAKAAVDLAKKSSIAPLQNVSKKSIYQNEFKKANKKYDQNLNLYNKQSMLLRNECYDAYRELSLATEERKKIYKKIEQELQIFGNEEVKYKKTNFPREVSIGQEQLASF